MGDFTKEDLIFFNLEVFYKTQEELKNLIKSTLIKKNIPFVEECGNIYGINHKDSPLFVAHMDTVNDKVLKNQIYYDNITKTIYRDNFILGADDRAGITLILEHIEDINFLFTRDEEIGAHGIKTLIKKETFIKTLKDFNIPCGIELDRKGITDIIGSMNDYCCEDLDDKIADVLKDLKYKVVMGVFTDVDYLRKLIPCVNLSVGYYNQHTNNEYLDLVHFKRLNNYILELNKIRGQYKLPIYNNYYDFGYYSSIDNLPWEAYYDNDKGRSYAIFPCDSCKSHERTNYLYTVDKFLCDDCLVSLQDEISKILNSF